MTDANGMDGAPHEPGERPPGPVFVVGSMRSGSTMLRLILDSHPNIAIGGETGFMGALLAAKDIPNWQFGRGWYQRLGWTEKEMDERLREFYDGLFRRYALEQGKTRWGEKTPFHTAHMAQMARVFPGAVFVGIVRHPGAVAASLRKKFHYTFPAALSYWTATNLDMVRAGSTLGQRFALCRYEDLVLEGEPVLREVLAHLDEPWSPSVLEHHRVQREKGAPRAVEGSTISHDPIDARRAVQWTQAATVEDYRALEGTADLAAFFGYDPVDPALRDRFTPAENSRKWTATGDDLALRRPRWEGRIDFDLRPPTVVIDASPEELAAQLDRVQQALARVRSRRAVRLVDALRKVQHGRSVRDIRAAWAIVRSPHDAQTVDGRQR
ncbi:MAG TPA: sulfotransferase [Nocardioidaceae bacterium]|nr:sulfotransferase [Nocardioidaceae bacterium]